MIGKTVEQIHPGQFSEFTKTVSESDVYLYAGISGDFNPAHVNQTYAEKTFFKSRIAHGLLSAGFISAAIAGGLPGPGTVYLRQELDFTAPVYMGDTITARVEVIEVNAEKNRVKMKTTCRNQDGEIVIDGYCLVSPPKRKKAERK
ncbi:MAG: MaoC family dehydratase [Desulfobacterales bacterium]|nr:MaoC family dehydratase [Desulfobacterales bacterium]